MRCTVFNRKWLLLVVVSFAVILVSMNAAWAGVSPHPFKELEGEFKMKGLAGDVYRGEFKTKITAVAGVYRAEGEVELSKESTREKKEISWVAEASSFVSAHASVLEALSAAFGVAPVPFAPSTLIEVNFDGNMILSVADVAEAGVWIALIARPATGDLLPTFIAVGAEQGIPIGDVVGCTAPPR